MEIIRKIMSLAKERQIAVGTVIEMAGGPFWKQSMSSRFVVVQLGCTCNVVYIMQLKINLLSLNSKLPLKLSPTTHFK